MLALSLLSNNFSEAIQKKTNVIQDFIFYPEKIRLVVQQIMMSQTNLTAFVCIRGLEL